MREKNMKITNIKIDELKPYKRNAKSHDETQIKKLKRAIKEFGFSVPLIVDENKEIIAGHGRLIAATELKMTEVPCVIKSDLSESQKKAMRIADNKISEGKWYNSILKDELLALNDENYELLETGMDEDELNDLLKQDEPIAKDSNSEVDKLGKMLMTCPHCKKKFSKKDANTRG